MGFEDLQMIFEASLRPSDEQIERTCTPQMYRERNETMTIPQLHPPPHPYSANRLNWNGKRSIRVEAYAGVNEKLKVFFCMTYFIRDHYPEAYRPFTNEKICHEIYCFDLHEFLCVVSKVNCLLEIREHGKFVYQASMWS